MQWDNLTTDGALPPKHRFDQHANEELRDYIMDRLSDLFGVFDSGSEINLISSARANWKRFPHVRE
jgi:hypothetical protein